MIDEGHEMLKLRKKHEKKAVCTIFILDSIQGWQPAALLKWTWSISMEENLQLQLETRGVPVRVSPLGGM
jgi:hypothetical protein